MCFSEPLQFNLHRLLLYPVGSECNSQMNAAEWVPPRPSQSFLIRISFFCRPEHVGALVYFMVYQFKWASQDNFYSTYSPPAPTAFVATSTFRIQLHKNSVKPTVSSLQKPLQWMFVTVNECSVYQHPPAPPASTFEWQCATQLICQASKQKHHILQTEIQLWQCSQAGALTYLVMILRSRLMSILKTAPPATKLCNRDVQLSSGLRNRYLTWTFPAVSIAHHHCRRRRVCDSEEQRFLSLLLWFSRHHWEEPCSDRAVTTTHSPAAGYISEEISLHAKAPNLQIVLPVPLRLISDVFAWSRRSARPALRYNGGLGVTSTVLSRQMTTPTLHMRTEIFSHLMGGWGEASTAINEATAWDTMYPRVKTLIQSHRKIIAYLLQLQQSHSYLRCDLPKLQWICPTKTYLIFN